MKTHTLKAWGGKLCGYSTDSRAYRVYNPIAKRVTKCRNATPPHNITNLVDDFYLPDVHDFVFAKLADYQR